MFSIFTTRFIRPGEQKEEPNPPVHPELLRREQEAKAQASSPPPPKLPPRPPRMDPHAGRCPHANPRIIDKMLQLGEQLANTKLRPYQVPFARRIVESVLVEDVDTITGLFSRQCAHPDTMVLTDQGPVPFKHLTPGMEIISADGKQLAVAKILAKEVTPPQETFTLHLHNKIPLTMSANHLVKLDSDKWGILSDGTLSENSQVQVQVSLLADATPDDPKLAVRSFYAAQLLLYKRFNAMDPLVLTLQVPPSHQQQMIDLLGVQFSSRQDSAIYSVQLSPTKEAEFLSYAFINSHSTMKELMRSATLYMGRNNRKQIPMVKVPYTANNNYLENLLYFFRHHGLNPKVEEDHLIFSGFENLQRLEKYFLSDSLHPEMAQYIDTYEPRGGYLLSPHDFMRALRAYPELKKGNWIKRSTVFFYREHGILLCVLLNLLKKIGVKEADLLQPQADGKPLISPICFAPVLKITKDATQPLIDIETDNQQFLGNTILQHNSGKTETISVVCDSMMLLLPYLHHTYPMDPRFEKFKDGFWVGIFSPSQNQTLTTYERMRRRLDNTQGRALMKEYGISFEVNRGDTIRMTNGSLTRCHTANKGAKIESKTYHLLILEEAQDIEPMMIEKCLAGDTIIQTPEGAIRLDEYIQNSDNHTLPVLTKDGYQLPSEFHINGTKPLFRVHVANGLSLDATFNHQLYIRTRSRRIPFYATVEEIETIMEKKGENGLVQMAVLDYEPLPGLVPDSPDDRDKGYLVGLMLGNGCTRGRTMPLLCGTSGTLDKAEPIAKRLFGVQFCRRYNAENDMVECGIGDPSTGNKTDSNRFKNYLKEIGVWGHKGEDKSIPMGNFSEEFYRGIVDGLFETDGCVSLLPKGATVSFASTSEAMTRQLHRILRHFGVHTGYVYRENNGSFGKDPKPLHIIQAKGKLDLLRFLQNFDLGIKQSKLIEGVFRSEAKKSRRSTTDPKRKYEDNLRFYAIKDIWALPPAPTYCLTVPGRNFIANSLVSSNSILPMGSDTAATTVMVGTANTKINSLYSQIEMNLAEQAKSGKVNHFEVDYLEVQKHVPRYKKYVEKQKEKLGEESDAFKMSFRNIWCFERGMAFSDQELCLRTPETPKGIYHPNFEIADRYYGYNSVSIGIDVGKEKDSTVLIAVEIDGEHPIEMAYSVAYRKRIIGWMELVGDRYNDQLPDMVRFCKAFRANTVVMDTTSLGGVMFDFFEAAVSDTDALIMPYRFSLPSKAAIYKDFLHNVQAGLVYVPAGVRTQSTREFRNFMHQMKILVKEYKAGSDNKGYLSCHAPTHKVDGIDPHDDYPDALALALWGAKDESTYFAEPEDNLFFETGRNELLSGRY